MSTQTNLNLTASDAQSLMTLLRPMISEIQRDKAAWNTAKRAFWQRCDPNNPKTEIFFDKLNESRLEYEKLQHKEKRLSDIQRKLKHIVSSESQKRALQQNRKLKRNQQPPITEPNVTYHTHTGWAMLDEILDTGFQRGRVSAILGASHTGKTRFLENITFNLLKSGLNGFFITMENNEDTCSERIDGMWDFNDNDEHDISYAGSCAVVRFDLESKPDKIKLCVDELKKRGKQIDFICIDQVELMSPCIKQDGVSHVADIIQELIVLAKELNVYLIFTSRAKRGAYGANGVYDKLNHPALSNQVDIEHALLITTTQEMRQVGNVELAIMRTTNIDNAGKVVKFKFERTQIDCGIFLHI